MTNKGLQSIEEKFLNTGDLFAIRFSEGLIFFEVESWEQMKYDPYTGVGVVEGEDSSGWEQLQHSGDDILHIEKKDKKVLHAGIGQAPSHIKRYTNYPEGETRLRSLPNLGSPRPGRDYGFVDGDDSPYEEPTDAEELFIVPGVHLDFNFYNADTEPSSPLLSIKMREYNVRILSPNDSVDRDAIRRILSPGSPIPIANAGSMDRQIDYDLEDYWGVTPVDGDMVKEIRGIK